MKAPRWSRLLYRASRSLNALDVIQQIVRDELLFAFLPPEQRAALTLEAYARSRSYGPGGEVFSGGLFSWELALLEDPRVPRSGRVLLAAAGGGRELKALLERGYEVYAFEPVAELLESSRAVARNTDAVVVQATYRDLIMRSEGQPGVMEDWDGKFDLCVLGWGSLSHLTETDSPLRALRAVRALSPTAPVIASFLLRRGGPVPTAGAARRLRRQLRRVFGALGGQSVGVGLQFLTSAGFMYSFSKEELFALSEQVGYDVARFDDASYPHALLVPRERLHSATASNR